ncbi:MAG: hypothetical protein RIA64_01400 [Rhodospirillales bacterium]
MRTDIEAARKLLEAKGLLRLIKPRKLVAAAKENDRSLSETLRLIAALHMGGQGQGPVPITERAIRAGAQ